MNVSARALARVLSDLPEPERPGQTYRIHAPQFLYAHDGDDRTAPLLTITLTARAVWSLDTRHLEWFLDIPRG